MVTLEPADAKRLDEEVEKFVKAHEEGLTPLELSALRIAFLEGLRAGIRMAKDIFLEIVNQKKGA